MSNKSFLSLAVTAAAAMFTVAPPAPVESSAVSRTDMLQFQPGQLAQIPLALIRTNPIALRSVDKDSDKFKEMVQSVREVGVLSAISVRPNVDKESGLPYYEVIDGLHRFTASLEAGLRADTNEKISTIPAQVMSMTDSKVLEAQLIANIHKVETQPSEYRNQLLKILKANPLMTEAELARTIGKSPSWLSNMLDLADLKPEFMALVNGGQISLSNAFILAKLPPEEQSAWVDRAQNLPPAQFVPLASARKQALDKARREGKSNVAETFVPIPHFQRLGDATSELNTMTTLSALVNKYAGGDPLKAAKVALQWAMNVDPDSLKTREAQWNADQLKKADAKKNRDAERAKKKADAEAKKNAAVAAKAEVIKAASTPPVAAPVAVPAPAPAAKEKARKA